MTTKEDIKAALWRGANTFRGQIDAANYKDYVLSMLFVKYLTDTYAENLAELQKKYPDEIRLERAKSRLPFVLKQEQTFDYLYDNRYDAEIGQKINAALRAIEDSNIQLNGVFRNVDFNSQSNLGNQKQKITTLRNLLEDFRSLDLRPSQIEVGEGQVPSDVLGDAFEYMIGEFASQAGKKAGSFFTPMMVSELMAQIAKPKAGDSIYDPTSGSSSLLIRAAKYAGVKNVSIYGQEMNGSSWSMGKMNMFIHDIMDSKIAWGDTLANPAHLDSDGNLMKFNVVVVLVVHPHKIDTMRRLTKMDVQGISAIIDLAHRIISLYRVQDREKKGQRKTRGDGWNVEPVKADVIIDILKDRLTGYESRSVEVFYDRPSRRFFMSLEDLDFQYAWDKKKYITSLPFPPKQLEDEEDEDEVLGERL